MRVLKLPKHLRNKYNKEYLKKPKPELANLMSGLGVESEEDEPMSPPPPPPVKKKPLKYKL